jgi:mRNA interferase MazF
VRRGEIRIVDLEPVRGTEADKRRPGIVVSNDGSNDAVVRHGRGVVTIVPLTSNVSRVFEFQVLLPAAATGLRWDSKAQAEQVRAMDVGRIGDVMGEVPEDLLARVDAALRVHLAL